MRRVPAPPLTGRRPVTSHRSRPSLGGRVHRHRGSQPGPQAGERRLRARRRHPAGRPHVVAGAVRPRPPRARPERHPCGWVRSRRQRRPAPRDHPTGRRRDAAPRRQRGLPLEDAREAFMAKSTQHLPGKVVLTTLSRSCRSAAVTRPISGRSAPRPQPVRRIGRPRRWHRGRSSPSRCRPSGSGRTARGAAARAADSTPGGKCAIEQPRVHSSFHQAVSTNRLGVAALGPSRRVSASTTASRRSVASSWSRRSATGPNVNEAITPGVPALGDESIVTSAAEPGWAV